MELDATHSVGNPEAISSQPRFDPALAQRREELEARREATVEARQRVAELGEIQSTRDEAAARDLEQRLAVVDQAGEQLQEIRDRVDNLQGLVDRVREDRDQGLESGREQRQIDDRREQLTDDVVFEQQERREDNALAQIEAKGLIRDEQRDEAAATVRQSEDREEQAGGELLGSQDFVGDANLTALTSAVESLATQLLDESFDAETDPLAAAESLLDRAPSELASRSNDLRSAIERSLIDVNAERDEAVPPPTSSSEAQLAADEVVRRLQEDPLSAALGQGRVGADIASQLLL